MRIVKRFCLVLSVMLVALTSMAQVTTGTITGTVKDVKGGVLTGASVEAIHEPSGSRYKTVSTGSGRYTLPGLRIGGPYKITVTYVGLKTEVISDVTIALGDPSVVDVTLGETSSQLAEVVVSGAARRGALISKDRKGTSTNINSRMISVAPTISRNVTDLIRIVPQSNGTSFAGQDNRAINFTLDGSIFNNSFGLSALNGGQTNSAPISLDAIQEIQVNMSPYSLRESGFTGASINAVTKSGTNTFHGTAFYNQRNQGLLGTKAGNGGKQDVTTTNFDVKQYGVSLGGPIIKNKLFFFLNYEAETRSDVGTSFVANDGSAPVGGNVTKVLKSDLDGLQSFLLSKFGYDAGAYQGFTAPTDSKKGVARVDWNLSDKHKLSVRGNLLLSKRDVVISNSNASNGVRNSANSMAFANSFYTINNNIYGLVAQLNSRFSSKISNDLTFGFTANRDFRSVKGGAFPTVDIQDGTIPLTTTPPTAIPTAQSGQSTTYISFGNDPFTPNNLLSTDTWQFSDNMTAYLGKHTVTAGLSYESFTYTNGFTALINGVYTFNSLTDFYTAANAYLANPSATTSPVYLRKYEANYSNLAGGAPWLVTTKARNISAYIQDETNLQSNFNLTYGIRFEVPYFVGSGYVNNQVDNLSFIDNDGLPTKLSTSQLPSPKLMINPRIGFNYDIKGDRSTQVRGGIGLFTGRPSFVYISNQLGNNGVLNGGVSVTNTAAYPFRPGTPATYPSFAPTPGVPAASYNIATTEKGFRFPQVLRSNIAVDQKVYKDIVATAEFMYTQSISNINYYNANLQPATSKFAGSGDTRAKFAGFGLSGAAQTNALRINNGLNGTPNLSDATVMESRPLGGSITGTFKVEKPAKATGLGWMVAYNYTRARDFMTPGSIAASSWTGIRAVNGNNAAEMAYSDNEVRHRVIGNVVYRYEFGNTAALQFGLFGQVQNQGRVSYTYSGDANGDGTTGNDLLYVPKDQSEMFFVAQAASGAAPAVTVQQQKDAWDTYINQDPYLKTRRGKFTERNGLLEPFVSRIDLSIQLELFRNIGKNRHTIQLRADIFNFGNLINPAAGVSYFVNTLTPLTATGTLDPSGAPIYRMTRVNNSIDYTTYRKSTTVGDVWSAQFGVRYIF